MDIIDLHCDLLAYLAINPDRNPLSPQPRCSGPQLKAGGVKTQVLAIASESNFYSLLMGLKQMEIFLHLPKEYPKYFSDESILPAFENASSFCTESEPLDHIFRRLDRILSVLHPLYIGITWNGQNRFGGGCGSNFGLKEDGKELLRYLSGKGIAIDFSHATDQMANDILNFIDTERLELRVMASHSNFRTKWDHERNLPDEISKEIIKREGLIGLVSYKKFIGSLENFFEQIAYGLSLGGKHSLAFGADFFCTEDLKSIIGPDGGFFEEMSDASKYPALIEMIQKELNLSEEILSDIAFKNAQKFIRSSKQSDTILK